MLNFAKSFRDENFPEKSLQYTAKEVGEEFENFQLDKYEDWQRDA